MAAVHTRPRQAATIVVTWGVFITQGERMTDTVARTGAQLSVNWPDQHSPAQEVADHLRSALIETEECFGGPKRRAHPRAAAAAGAA